MCIECRSVVQAAWAGIICGLISPSGLISCRSSTISATPRLLRCAYRFLLHSACQRISYRMRLIVWAFVVCAGGRRTDFRILPGQPVRNSERAACDLAWGTQCRVCCDLSPKRRTATRPALAGCKQGPVCDSRSRRSALAAEHQAAKTVPGPLCFAHGAGFLTAAHTGLSIERANWRASSLMPA